MKDDAAVLYPNEKVAERVTTYSAAHSTPLPKYITDFHAEVVRGPERSVYLTSNFQSQAHVLLARLMGAKRVLEVGVFVGYSAMVWAHAVGPEGRVTGLEFNPDYAKKAEKAFAANGVKNVEVIVGDALETLPKLNPAEPYDLIFIDAQKSGYPSYLSHILAQSAPGAANRLLRPGGLVVGDNVLRRALVADDSADNPAAEEQARAQMRSEYAVDNDIECIREYNSAVVGSQRLESFLMPLFDGLSVARLVD